MPYEKNVAPCRAAAAHDMVLREIKRRAGDVAEVKSESGAAGDSAKRRRQTAPEELCPYCDHIYTVRDGFSTKTNSAGERCVMPHHYLLFIHIILNAKFPVICGFKFDNFAISNSFDFVPSMDKWCFYFGWVAFLCEPFPSFPSSSKPADLYHTLRYLS